MCPYLDVLRTGLRLTGDLARDVPAFLAYHKCPGTARHCAGVATEAARLAVRFDADPGFARMAGWLHDISAVVPVSDRVAFAQATSIEILPEEFAFPLILHQKLSVVFARELFGVTTPGILSAIACHTTLKRQASSLDKVVFLADKIAWDQPGVPPYLDRLLLALEDGLDAGVCVYLGYLWERRHTLAVLHPWLVRAYEDLCSCFL